MTARIAYSWGPKIGRGETHFRLWAPGREDVRLEIEGERPIPMTATTEGWRAAVRNAPAGTRYRFRIGDVAVPDPASRAQAGGVRGFSIVAPPPPRRDTSWRGRPWEEAVIYEVHAGLMGGFGAIAEHLPSLRDVGITAIELMPIASFPGARNWGYDGVLPFAPDETYGTPDALRSLIAKAHTLGIMIFLDVVYNHFGPDGNYLPLYAPDFFRSDRHTPWGGAIDFRRRPVRNFFVENALYWLNEFGFDGLRFDAVHAIADRDFLLEMSEEIHAGVEPDRHVHLILENEHNDTSLLDGPYRAQWNDDIHHVLHVLLTGESAGYYGAYSRAPAQLLARALANGFVDADKDAVAGRSTATLPTTAFISFLQNHDHIGNRAFGERLTRLANRKALEAAIALLLLCPQIPLLFMGEDAGADEPFLYFCDHRDDGLADAVREGRRAEFAKFPEFSDEKKRAEIPDPNALESFERSRPSLDTPGHWRTLYRTLLQLRREHVVPRLRGTTSERAKVIGEKAVLASWRMGDGARLTLAANFGDETVRANLPDDTPFWGETPGGIVGAQSTLAWLERP